MANRKLTPDQVTYIKSQRLKKMACDIAQELNVPAHRVSQFLRDENLLPPKDHIFPATGRTKYGAIVWTDEMTSFLVNNHPKMTNRELAAALGLKLTKVREKCYELGLKRMEMEYWTKDQVDFLLAYYDIMGDVEMAEIFEALWPKKKKWTEKHIRKKRVYLHLEREKPVVEKIRKRNAAQGRYASVVKRWKTHGRKQGDTAIWRYYKGKPMVMIKWSGGRFFGIYDTLAHITWFLNYGPIPDGMNITHKDGDTLNCSIENLEMVSNMKNMERNSGSLHLSDAYIRGMLTPKNPELRKLLPQELIDLKRNQLILNRTINGKSTNHSASPGESKKRVQMG